MSILNQSIPSTGQLQFHSKPSETCNVSRLPQISESFLPNLSKKTSLAITTAASPTIVSPLENDTCIRIEEDDYTSAKHNFFLSVAVSSAVKLEAKQIELIAKKMQKLTGFRNLKVENVVDSSLIAGFIIRYGDNDSQVIDLSVHSQLSALSARVESSEKRIASNVESWRAGKYYA